MLGSVSMCSATCPEGSRTNCSTHTDEDGFCSQEDDASKTGAKVTTALSLELWLELYANLEEKKTNVFSHKFFNLTDTLEEQCKPLTIEDFVDGASKIGSGLLPIPTDETSSITPSQHLRNHLQKACRNGCCHLGGPQVCQANPDDHS